MSKSNTTPRATGQPTTTDDVEPITIGDDITITDAFVDFNVGFSNPGELHVKISDRIPRDLAYPIAAGEDSDEMLAETDEGLVFGWQDGPAQPPADTSPRTTTHTVEHEQLGEIERVPMYQHEVKYEQNDRDPDSVLTVTFDAKHPNSITTRVEFAQEIIDKYVNGPLGSNTTSYWAHRKSRHELDDKYDPYITGDVVLTPRSIYTWEVTHVHDLHDDQDVYKEI